jgi:hypothetical protein
VSPADARAALIQAESMRDWAAVKAHLTKARSVDPADGDAESALVALSLSLSITRTRRSRPFSFGWNEPSGYPSGWA